MGESYLMVGSFSEPMSDIISYLSPHNHQNNSFTGRDYPWRRRAYDRTLSCPDLARQINDFLSPGVEFVCNDDMAIPLCA